LASNTANGGDPAQARRRIHHHRRHIRQNGVAEIFPSDTAHTLREFRGE
jgi:hypothetical protein